MEHIQQTELYLNNDHVELFKMLDKFRNNRFVSSEQLQTLKWRLERHFYTEEKSLLLVCEKTKDIDPTIYKDLFNEHDEILDELNTAVQELGQKGIYNWTRLKILLKDHLISETNSLYVLLQNNLEPAQIEKINATLHQVGNKGFYPIKQLRHFIKEKIPNWTT